jgi:hypothetical protein
MAKGGSESKEATLPAWQEQAYQQGINLAKDVSQTGYVPYTGPEVAAFSPMQEAAFQSTDQMANAFGMQGTGGQQYMPQAEMFGDGVRGYSSIGLYDDAVQGLQQRAPAQANYIASFGIDPVTGQVGSRAATQQNYKLEMQPRKRGK